MEGRKKEWKEGRLGNIIYHSRSTYHTAMRVSTRIAGTRTPFTTTTTTTSRLPLRTLLVSSPSSPSSLITLPKRHYSSYLSGGSTIAGGWGDESLLLLRAAGSRRSKKSILLDQSSRMAVSTNASNPFSTSSTSSAGGKVLTLKTINPRVVSAKYAVRGELAVRAEAFRQELAEVQSGATSNLPFKQVIAANIGNPQQLGQKPITFFRQVLSILEYPDILQTEYAEKIYPQDVIERAKWLLKEIGSIGAYSHSQGVPAVRKSVARFIEERDGYPANPNHIFLTVGASAGVNNMLNAMCASRNTGILIPVPQYPLYTATLSLLDATPIPYYLDEETGWSTNLNHIKEEIQTAKAKGIDVRCIVIINPGNPTGASLKEEDIRSVVALAKQEKLVILADEVYQTNVFAPNKFTSFKKVLAEAMQKEPGKGYEDVELVSLHSTSKGMVGECGHRGGYFELVNFHPDVVAQIYKLLSINLCPPVVGQALVELMVNPPKPGQPSYEQYTAEYNAIFEQLQQRALALYNAFTKMEGVSCAPPQGSMYLFPTITLPEKAVQKAKEEGRLPDEWYCLRMLEATGTCVVPGSGFGQKDGTWHFRTTFLAEGGEWIEKLVEFHERIMEENR